MARTNLNFEYNGREYSLCYNIGALRKLDRSGLLAQIAEGERPVTLTRDLFFAAFEANHSNVSNDTRRKIFEEFSDSSKDGSLLDCLCEMLTGVCETLTPKGSIMWRMD